MRARTNQRAIPLILLCFLPAGVVGCRGDETAGTCDCPTEHEVLCVQDGYYEPTSPGDSGFSPEFVSLSVSGDGVILRRDDGTEVELNVTSAGTEYSIPENKPYTDAYLGKCPGR